VPICMHFRGGEARDGKGFCWQINGTEGDLQLTARSGHTQQVQLELRAGRSNDKELKVLEPPIVHQEGGPPDTLVGNVARLYSRMAADLSHGTHRAPTFADAVEIHQVIAAIERSAASGQRVRVGDGAA
jgi:predicted dehydrogenase